MNSNLVRPVRAREGPSPRLSLESWLRRPLETHRRSGDRQPAVVLEVRDEGIAIR
jgi:hypothetical protein